MAMFVAEGSVSMLPARSDRAIEWGSGVRGGGDDQDSRVEVSVVIPVLNEAPNVPEMCRRLRQVLEPRCTSFELIFVAGGSEDGTEEAVLGERAADTRVKLLWLSRNFGHQEAISAGLDSASGDAVITMDGDLQHPPEVLPELLARWHQGFEIVTTVRLSTADAGLLKRATSHWFYALLNRLSNLNLKEGSADFRLMDRAAVNALRQMPERSRFLRGMVQWVGYEQTSVPYSAAGREAGVSKYSLLRQLQFAILATVAFSATPLYLVAVFGFVLAAASFVYGAFAIVAKLLTDVPIEGWASVLTLVAFIGGVQLISLGVAGAYIAKIYEEAKARPIYIVRGAYGFANHAEGARRVERAVPQRESAAEA
jgi:glycosyltransferase involved in cell wall biosynthesis